MPLKIPFTSLVVTGHRGSGLTGSQSIPWVQALSGQKKDACAARARTAGHPELLPRPKPRNALPALSIKRMTDYTRFPDDKAVAKAAARTTLEPGTPPEVAAAVSNHLDRAFKAHAAPLILVGEQHSRRTSLMINLAAIASAKGRNAVVLFERGPDEIEKLVGHADMLDVELRVDSLSAIEARRKVMRDLSLDATRETTADILMAYVADKAGARIGAFDTPGGTAADQAEREEAMEKAIRDAVAQNDGPVIVIMGAKHLPRIHDHVEGLLDVAAISVVSAQIEHPQTSDFRKRSSYLLANDDILKIRSDPALDRAVAWDPLTYAEDLLNPGQDVLVPQVQQPYGVPGPSTFTRP